MWITVLMIRLKSTVIHDLGHIICIFRLWNQVMLSYSFPDDLANRQSWRKGRIWILENDLHLGTHIAHFFIGKTINIFSIEENLSVCFLNQS